MTFFTCILVAMIENVENADTAVLDEAVQIKDIEGDVLGYMNMMTRILKCWCSSMPSQ